MITAEVKVNGSPLAQIYIRRVDSLPTNQESEHIYNVEYYEPENGLIKCIVTHKYSDSFLILFDKAIKSIMLKSKTNKDGKDIPTARGK